MDKMKFETPNISAENVTKIASLFPGVVAEGKVNFDLLRTMLGDEIFTDEAYEFTWVGKREAIAEAGRPIRKTLRPFPGESKDWNSTENLYIEGDNLEALKLLQESYLGKVKMIYIDPPYNTGNDFIYRDNFSQSREDYDEEAESFDEHGDRLIRNYETNGRFHSDWCSMMYPRLVLARNLLRGDGAVFISIDDGEVGNLRKLADEVFGESNFIANIIWQKKYTRANDAKWFSDNHDHILCYGKDKQEMILNMLPRNDDQLAAYSNPDNHPKGVWKATPLHAKSGTNTSEYTFSNGVTWKPPIGTYRRFNNEAMKRMDENNEIWFGADGVQTPSRKSFLCDVKDGVTPVTLWPYDEVGHNHEANNELKTLEIGGLFNNPKPTRLLKRALVLATNTRDIILDFFAGSSTTADAVMQLNAEDGGKRKFIMVQLPEVCADGTEAAKAGYTTICEIGKERIRRAGEKIKEEVKASSAQLKPGEEPKQVPDIGFRVLKVDDSNMNEVYYAAGDYTQDMLAGLESNIKADRTDLDLLFGCLLDWGLPLSMPHSQETIDGFTVHTYNSGDLVACFDEHVSEKAIREIASRKPLRAVFRDSSFTSSPEKINVFEIFKLLAPNTAVKVL